MKIGLSGNMETSLVPLYGRAVMSKEGFFDDKDAELAIDLFDYDFSKLHIERKTQVMLSIRARLIDDFTKEYLKDNPNSVVVYLGCGLDARASRLKFPAKKWYDLDFPDVIEIKRQLYSETEQYQYIASSVTDWEWINQINEHTSALIIAEGLLMYLCEEEVRELLLRLRDKFGCATVIFDAFSRFTANQMKRHPSIKGANAAIQWGIDKPIEIESFGNGIQHIKTLYYFEKNAIANIPKRSYRLMFRLSGAIKSAREAHRIFVIKLNRVE